MSNFDAYMHSEEISTLAPFTAHYVGSMEEISLSFTFKVGPIHYAHYETPIILNVDASMDDLKYYAGTSNILKYRNRPIPSRQLSSLTMSNFEHTGTD
jgi:hypothetical protein